MSKNASQSISIVIEESIVKTALVKSNGSVVKATQQRASGNGPAEVASALKKCLAGMNTKKSNVVLVIPASAASIKNIDVPSTDPEEIRSIVNLQASRHTPFSKEEIVASHISIGTQGNSTKVLLVIVNRKVVKEKMAIFQSAGIDIDTIRFAPEAIAKFYLKALNVKPKDGPIGIIDIAAKDTSLIIASQRTAVSCRNIPVGTEALASGDAARNQLVNELKQTLDAYKDEGVDAQPSNYVITTSHPSGENLKQAVSESLGATVDVNAAIDVLKVSKGMKKKLSDSFGDDSALDVIATGGFNNQCEVDFTPEEIFIKRSITARSKEMTKAGAFVFITILAISFGLVSKIYFLESFLNQKLKDKYAHQKEEVALLESQQEKNILMQKFLKTRMLSLDAYNELVNFIPRSIYLNRFQAMPDGMVVIQGTSETRSQVFDFLSDINNSEIFTDGKASSVSAKREDDVKVISFQLTAQLAAIIPPKMEEETDMMLEESPLVAEGEL